MGEAFLQQSMSKGGSTIVLLCWLTGISGGSFTTSSWKSYTKTAKFYDNFPKCVVGNTIDFTGIKFKRFFFINGMHRTFDHNGEIGCGWKYTNPSNSYDCVNLGYYQQELNSGYHFYPWSYYDYSNTNEEELVLGSTEIPGYDNGFKFHWIIDSANYSYVDGHSQISFDVRCKAYDSYASPSYRGSYGSMTFCVEAELP